MKRHDVRWTCALLAMVLAVSGCEPVQTTPPENLPQLQQHQAARQPEYTGRTIALHNLRRVLSDDIPTPERVESMKVIQTLNVDDTDTRAALSEALTAQTLPPAVRQPIVAYLGGAAATTATSTVQETLLGDVVKQWAAAGKLTGAQELQYRQTVERMSGKPWDQALLEGLNRTEKFPRGSALEVLAGRLPLTTLAKKINALTPRTAAVLAMQNFSRRFAYLPRTRAELLSCVIVSAHGRGQLITTSRQAALWRTSDKYVFNVRDFHLISSLTSDGLRDANLNRMKLVPMISQAIAARRRVAGGLGGARRNVFRCGRMVDFDSQVPNLTLADLWNLKLLSDMIDRGRVRRMLGVTARQDHADRTTQWGGLISYAAGQAEAKLYWPAEKRGDEAYVPSRKMMLSASDSLAYFVGHFSRAVTEPAWTGPSDAELKFAKDNNVHGVVFTNAGANRINAAYFTPRGFVVDLGDFTTP